MLRVLKDLDLPEAVMVLVRYNGKMRRSSWSKHSESFWLDPLLGRLVVGDMCYPVDLSVDDITATDWAVAIDD